MKPTAGRVPRTGHVPAPSGPIESFVEVGPIARTVRDCLVALSVMAGPDGFDTAAQVSGVPMHVAGMRSHLDRTTRLRVAVARGPDLLLTPDVDAILARVAHSLSDRGHRVEERHPAGLADAIDVHMGVAAREGGAGIRALLQAHGTAWQDRSSLIDQLVERIAPYERETAEWPATEAAANAFRRRMETFLESFDVLVMATTPDVAPLHGETFEPRVWRGFSLVVAHNVTGWPVVTVPAGQVGPLPVGIQIAAAPQREDICARVAMEVEEDARSARVTTSLAA